MQICLASRNAVGAIEARSTSRHPQNVFLVSMGLDSKFAAFISEEEYEDSLLCPDE